MFGTRKSLQRLHNEQQYLSCVGGPSNGTLLRQHQAVNTVTSLPQYCIDAVEGSHRIDDAYHCTFHCT
jgi:hypothetical protein